MLHNPIAGKGNAMQCELAGKNTEARRTARDTSRSGKPVARELDALSATRGPSRR